MGDALVEIARERFLARRTRADQRNPGTAGTAILDPEQRLVAAIDRAFEQRDRIGVELVLDGADRRERRNRLGEVLARLGRDLLA